MEAERKLKDRPVLIKLPSGYIQPSPWLAIANKQLELMAKYMAELGLSAVSGTRAEAKPPYEKKPWDGADAFLTFACSGYTPPSAYVHRKRILRGIV